MSPEERKRRGKEAAYRRPIRPAASVLGGCRLPSRPALPREKAAREQRSGDSL